MSSSSACLSIQARASAWALAASVVVSAVVVALATVAVMIAEAPSVAVTGLRAAALDREAAATAQAAVTLSSPAASLPVRPALSAWERIGRISYHFFFVISLSSISRPVLLSFYLVL